MSSRRSSSCKYCEQDFRAHTQKNAATPFLAN
uniref:Zinc finger-like protein ZFRA n=1 Tax=Mus musculus TaxID=10090 RepID=Q6DQH2_MOUSE|nr:zinc finger-like protein ZFRA [Mus musculus]